MGVVVSLFTRFAVIASDILVLAVTWAKTLQLYREARRLKIATPLTTLLLRYGKVTKIASTAPSLLRKWPGSFYFLYADPIHVEE